MFILHVQHAIWIPPPKKKKKTHTNWTAWTKTNSNARISIGGAYHLFMNTAIWKTEGWGKEREAGDKGIKGVFVCVSAHRSTGASQGLSTLSSHRDQNRSAWVLWACPLLARAGTDRQLLLNPDCFRFTGCERAWLRGCDPSEGGLPPPSLLSLLPSFPLLTSL